MKVVYVGENSSYYTSGYNNHNRIGHVRVKFNAFILLFTMIFLLGMACIVGPLFTKDVELILIAVMTFLGTITMFFSFYFVVIEDPAYLFNGYLDIYIKNKEKKPTHKQKNMKIPSWKKELSD